MRKLNRVAWLVLVAGVVGCAKQQVVAVEESRDALKNLSALALGSGFDLALDRERPACFARDPAVSSKRLKWEATGFTVFTGNEVAPKVRTAIQVGVKLDVSDGQFGTETATRVGDSGEQARFVMLARFTERVEEAGAIRAPACSSLASTPNNNGVGDFVDQCGDQALTRKVFGGHVLISWLRAPARPAVDELMGLMFGARAVGSTIDPRASLEALMAQGLGQEELLLEFSGLPVTLAPVQLSPTHWGHTVESTLEFLNQLEGHAFTSIIDYSLTRYTVPEIDSCLALTTRHSSLSETEWACVDGNLSGLAANRDGSGDIAFLHDNYEVHRFALKELVPAGRVVFNTVPQVRCSQDSDGDPDFETSGDCQVQLLQNFVSFFEACTDKSAALLTTCRNGVLPTVTSCSDFERQGCVSPQMTLADGTTVACDEAGINAALADVVGYQVVPPRSAPLPGLTPPLVIEVNSITSLPNDFTASTSLCGITGVRGHLHESYMSLEPYDDDPWLFVGGRDDFSVEITCVKTSNFTFANGGSFHISNYPNGMTFPALNGGTPASVRMDPGDAILLGWFPYLDEPSTEIFVTNPDAWGHARAVSRDLFPLVSTAIHASAFTINSNPPRSGGTPAGTLFSPDVGRPSRATAGIDFLTRSTEQMSTALTNNAFCYFTGISGRYFNDSDSARISTSDGFTTLITTTPVNKDRNPGARVQCVQYDQP